MNTIAPTTPFELGMDKAITVPSHMALAYLECLLFPLSVERDMEGPLLLPQVAQSAETTRQEEARTDSTVEQLRRQHAERRRKREGLREIARISQEEGMYD